MTKLVSKITLRILLCIVLFAGSVLLNPDGAAAGGQTALVKGGSVDLRSGPGSDYSKIGEAKKGTTLEVVGQKDGWYKLKYWKIYGWATGEYLSIKGSSKDKAVIVKAQSVNIRSGPGTTYSRVGGANKGQQFSVSKEKSGWFEVNLGDGKKGWISSTLVDVKYQTAPAPAPNPTPEPPKNPSQEPPSGGDPDPSDDVPTGKYLTVRSSSLNVRTGPGTLYPIVAAVKAPERYTILQEDSGWYKIDLLNQKQGWVAGWLVDVSSGSLPPSRGDDVDPPGDGSEETVGKLSNIEFETANSKEKVIITSDGPVKYSISTLKDPSRLVVDIQNSDLNELKDVVTDGNILTKIRVAQYSLTPMTVRLVLDLNKNAGYRPSLDMDGKRLTIELTEPSTSINGKVIVVDAGHGGWDNGATGVTGLKEKEVNLDVALRVKEKLEALGATVIMTRSDDTFISLSERSRIANDAKADLFVSIHSNANVNPAVNGTATYYNTPADNPGLSAQREKLARLVQKSMVSYLGIRDIGIIKENFHVIRATTMPSILTESAFLSNAGDEALLKESSFREKIAQGIVDGLTEYFNY